MNLRLQLAGFLLACFSATLSAAPAPDFTVTSSDNQTLKLYQDYVLQGKVLVIEMFFTTCPPCNTHAPLLQNLYTQMQAQYPGKVEFLLLSTLSTDTNVKVGQYKTSKNMTMPAAGNDGGSLTALQPYISNQFGEYIGTPTFIVIAPNTGEVIFDIRGGNATQTMNLLSEQIALLLPPSLCLLEDQFGNPLEAVTVKVESAAFDTSFLAHGNYNLNEVASLNGLTYTITPQKLDNPLSGLTTYDLVLISKHILGIEPFLCDWQVAAADVNCSNSISTLDIVTARKLILGILTELPCGSFKFLPATAEKSDGACQDFVGVKIGDVNAGVCDGVVASPDDRGTVTLQVADRYLEAGETAEIRLKTTVGLALEGFQLAFDIQPSKAVVAEITAPGLVSFDTDAYHISRQSAGTLPVSWVYGQGANLDAGAPFLTLQLTARQSGYLSDMIGLQQQAGLMPEMYRQNGIYQIQLEWLNSVERMTVYPNPAGTESRISVFLTEARECRVQLVDVYGKVAKDLRFNGQKGNNEWPVSLQGLSTGMYTLQIDGFAAEKLLINR